MMNGIVIIVKALTNICIKRKKSQAETWDFYLVNTHFYYFYFLLIRHLALTELYRAGC